MYKNVLLLLTFVFMVGMSNAQSKYSRVKVDLTKTNISQMAKLGLEVDHGFLIPGVHFVNDFSAHELDLIRNAGIEYFVLIDDVKEDYKARKGQSVQRSTQCDETFLYEYDTPSNYSYGTMGGYHTYDEMVEVLEDMRAKYPELITEINVVEGFKTWEDNDIIWLKLSDNADVDEDEPEALYTALHHAREPNGLSQMIFYMWYLLENYETDERVKYLVDNTEMYFMPCLNPDGYKYNELTDPDGGGFWRKNRRPNDDEDRIGVDLNRNYGFFWGFDDFGSSPILESSTYRGPQAFSEPETQAVRSFCNERNFQVALNYHTHGNLLIHPWGYNDTPTEEDSVFQVIGETMTKENDFLLGTGTETVGYVVNGNSDDYMYGEDVEKDKIYSFTPEVGPRFWPQESEIDQLNKSCMLQNLNTAHILLNYYEEEVTNIPAIVENKTGTFDLRISKPGLKEGNVSVYILPQDEHLIIPDFFFLIALDLGEQTNIPLNFIISENAPSYQEMHFDVVLDYPDFADTTTYSFIYRNSEEEEILIDDFVTDNAWDNAGGEWGLTQSHYVSAPTSLTDSPNGMYTPNRRDSIALMDQISLEEADFTRLKFSARWDIEYRYDYVLVQVSDDDGENWTSLCGNYTRAGEGTHGTNDPLYDGIQSTWVVEEMDLTDYQGQLINLRLMFVSDVGVEQDGFYIDDIMLVNDNLITTNTEDVVQTNFMQVMPSLNNGTFDVRINSEYIGENSFIEIFDVNGKVVEKRNILQPLMTFAISTALNGYYIVKFTDRNGRVSTSKINIIR